MNTSRTPEECVRTVVHSYESLREQGHDDAEALTLVAHQYGLTKDRARWATGSAYVHLLPGRGAEEERQFRAELTEWGIGVLERAA